MKGKEQNKMDFDAIDKLGFSAKSISDITLDKDFQRNKNIHNSWLITRKVVAQG